MRTLGVDLAAQPKNTAACLIAWSERSALVEQLEARVDDGRLSELTGPADKVGLDVPFGWPLAFVAAIDAHTQFEEWPTADTVALRFRRTDLYVREKTGKWPLSVSTDRIGITAFRAARLLSAENAERTGSGKFVEVYPRAARDRFALERSDVALKRSAPWLTFYEGASELCAVNEHCLDAVIAALVARAAAIGLCDPIPAEDIDAARREGWIALPVQGSLQRLTLSDAEE